MADQGIYSDLDALVRAAFPSWLANGPVDVVTDPSGRPFAYVAGRAVAFARMGLAPDVRLESMGPQDADHDGIPDPLDILLGGKKVVLAAAPYKETYRKLAYPNGDLPRGEGVCTDVVVRALRNAGFDLQKLLHDDVMAAPRAYPGIQHTDTSVDHRRVRNLLPYFLRHWERLPNDPHDGSVPWLPGDVVFLDTLRAPGPDHIGIVSDRAGESQLPLIINSWTNGYVSKEMDLLSFVPVTHRFRVPGRKLRLLPESRGLEVVLQRAGVQVDDRHRQMLLVTTPTWTANAGFLRRFRREERHGSWNQEGAALPVRIGEAGLGLGRGITAAMASQSGNRPQKREGDRRSPAGAFALGDGFGTKVGTSSQGSHGWPLRRVDASDVWVDDRESAFYNTWQKAGPSSGKLPWKSAENLTDYPLALIIRHNDAPIVPGAGSAVFMHSWDTTLPTSGCTGLRSDDMRVVLQWLEPDASPVLVQIPGWVWD